MLTPALMLLAGLAIIIKGGDLFVGAAVRAAQLLKVPKVVVGGTLVSLATTSPEMAVSLFSGLRGESGLAVGNAIGSCICNLALILGVSAVLRPIPLHPVLLRAPLACLFGAGLVLFVFTLDLTLARWRGALLMTAGAGYFVWDFWRHWRASRRAEAAEAEAIAAGVAGGRWAWLETPWGTATQFAGGAALVMLGSHLLVDGAVTLAGALGIPPLMIGLTVVAAGTSLPELVTAISAGRRNVSDLSVGNLLGANIANLTLVIGLAATLHTVTMDRMTQMLNFPALLLVLLIFWWMQRTGRGVSRREGIFLLALYGGYLALLVALTLMV